MKGEKEIMGLKRFRRGEVVKEGKKGREGEEEL